MSATPHTGLALCHMWNGALYKYCTIALQAQLPQVPSQPLEQFTAEDLPEVPTQEPAGICKLYRAPTL